MAVNVDVVLRLQGVIFGRSEYASRNIDTMHRYTCTATVSAGRKSIHQWLASNPGKRNSPNRFNNEKPPRNSASPRLTGNSNFRRFARLRVGLRQSFCSVWANYCSLLSGSQLTTAQASVTITGGRTYHYNRNSTIVFFRWVEKEGNGAFRSVCNFCFSHCPGRENRG